jgi:hypothetical protein
VAKVEALSIPSELKKNEIPALVNKYCREQHWLKNLFNVARTQYDTWIQREQVRFILDDVLASTTLRQCFRTFSETEFSGKEDLNARVAFDLLAEINTYIAIPTPSERAVAACRIWRGFLKNGAEVVPLSANIGVTPEVQRQMQAAVKADTNDICTLRVFFFFFFLFFLFYFLYLFSK